MARKTLAVAAQVEVEVHAELDLIRQQRGERFLSETVRAALDEFRRSHWRARLESAEPVEQVA